MTHFAKRLGVPAALATLAATGPAAAQGLDEAVNSVFASSTGWFVSFIFVSIEVIEEFLEDPIQFLRARGAAPAPSQLPMVAALANPDAASVFPASDVRYVRAPEGPGQPGIIWTPTCAPPPGARRAASALANAAQRETVGVLTVAAGAGLGGLRRRLFELAGAVLHDAVVVLQPADPVLPSAGGRGAAGGRVQPARRGGRPRRRQRPGPAGASRGALAQRAASEARQ